MDMGNEINEMKDCDELIAIWIKAQALDPEAEDYEKASWAVDELLEMEQKNPEGVWALIPKIIEYDSSEKTLGALGAGLIEDLLVHYGADFIDRIVAFASTCESFKKALAYTFLDEDDVPPEVFNKFKEAS